MFDEEKDWLAQEIIYESRISAWDLDEPNMVKKYHEDNCPRERLAKEHISIHNSDEKVSFIKSNIVTNSKQTVEAKRVANIISIIIVFLFLVMLIIFG